MCHAVRAPGSNVTRAPRARAGSGASNNGSIRTEPVKYSAEPFVEGCDPFRLICIFRILLFLLRNSYFLFVFVQSVSESHRFEFHPDRVLDRNYRSRLKFESRQHRAELVDRQRIVAIQHHITAPVTHSYDKQFDLEVSRRLPLGEHLAR